jgi:WD40 repeat protein
MRQSAWLIMLAILLGGVVSCSDTGGPKERERGKGNAVAEVADGKPPVPPGNGQPGAVAPTADWGEDWIKVHRVALSEDGKRALIGCGLTGPKGTAFLEMWDTETGKMQHRVQIGKGFFVGLAFRPDGKTAVTATSDGKVNVYDVARGSLIRSITAHQALDRRYPSLSSGGFALSDDGQMALTQGADERTGRTALRAWNLERPTTYRYLGEASPGGFVAISPNNKLAIIGDWVPRLAKQSVLRELGAGKVVRSFPLSDGWSSPFTFTPSGREVVITKIHNKKGGGITPDLAVYDLAENRVLQQFPLEKLFWSGFPQLLVFDEHRVLVPYPDYAGDEGVFRLQYYSLKTGKQERTVTFSLGEAHPIRSPIDVSLWALSRDGRRALVVDRESVQLWDVQTGTRLRNLKDPLFRR